METITNIKGKIKKKKREIEFLRLTKYPEYEKVADQLNELRLKYEPVLEKEKIFLQGELNQLFTQLEELKLKKDSQVTEEMLNWLYSDYVAGVSFGYGPVTTLLKIVWVSDDKKYAIITRKGCYVWVSIGQSDYCAAEHWGVELFAGSRLNGNIIGTVSGRLTKIKKEELIYKIENYG